MFVEYVERPMKPSFARNETIPRAAAISTSTVSRAMIIVTGER
jgi:hypothetical protein